MFRYTHHVSSHSPFMNLFFLDEALISRINITVAASLTLLPFHTPYILYPFPPLTKLQFSSPLYFPYFSSFFVQFPLFEEQ